MKSKTKYFFPALLFLTACSISEIQSEEEQYQQYVKDVRASYRSSLSSFQRSQLNQQHYIESGLKSFINRAGERLEGERRNVSELKKFYDNVILGKYAGHNAQPYLKVVFITYAIKTANLTKCESAEACEFLVLLTRDLVQPETGTNATLIVDCLTAARGRVDASEFSQLVRLSKFKVKMFLEEMKIEQEASAKTASPSIAEAQARTLRDYEQALAAITALATN